MNNKPCIKCNKPMNGGVYRYPNKCPHCFAIQDGTLDAKAKTPSSEVKSEELEIVDNSFPSFSPAETDQPMIVEEVAFGDMELSDSAEEQEEVEYVEELVYEDELEEGEYEEGVEYVYEDELDDEEVINAYKQVDDLDLEIEQAVGETAEVDAFASVSAKDAIAELNDTADIDIQDRVELAGAELKRKVEAAKKRAASSQEVVRTVEEIEAEKIAEAEKKKAEEAIKRAEEAKKRAEEARLKAEQDRVEKMLAEQQAAEEEAKRKAEEAKRLAEEEAKRKAEAEAKAAEEAKKAEEAKRKAEEAKKLAEEAKRLDAKKAEEEKKRVEKVAAIRLAEKASANTAEVEEEQVFELNSEDRIDYVVGGDTSVSKDAGALADKSRELELVENKKLKEIVLTTETAHDLEILKRIDIVTAECVLGMHVFKDLFSGSAAFTGGKSNAAQNGLKYAKNTVMEELRREAFKLNANAVVGVSVEFNEISNGEKTMLFVVATGTAVEAVL